MTKNNEQNKCKDELTVTRAKSLKCDEMVFSSPGRRAFEHRYMLASASPSAISKFCDMFCPVQLIVLTQS